VLRFKFSPSLEGVKRWRNVSRHDAINRDVADSTANRVSKIVHRPNHCGPRLGPASNRNANRASSLEEKGGPYLGLTICHLHVSIVYKNW
jgi:hypothetical protein